MDETTRRAASCDPRLESSLSPVPHDYETIGQEENALATGETYDLLKCQKCGRTVYSKPTG